MLKQEFPNIVVYISNRDARLMSGDISLDILKSAIKIQGLNPSLLATAHGKMIKEPSAAIEMAIREANENL